MQPPLVRRRADGPSFLHHGWHATSRPSWRRCQVINNPLRVRQLAMDYPPRHQSGLASLKRGCVTWKYGSHPTILEPIRITTCRTRGVKYDEQKPLCRRCVREARLCGGRNHENKPPSALQPALTFGVTGRQPYGEAKLSRSACAVSGQQRPSSEGRRCLRGHILPAIQASRMR